MYVSPGITLGLPYSLPPSEHTLPSGQLRASPTLPPSWYQASGPLLLNTVSAPMWQHLETILLQYGTDKFSTGPLKRGEKQMIKLSRVDRSTYQ